MKSGFVSLIGRPNAGKSTLLNRIVGEKVAIVSDKPQTTRTRVLGVKTYPGTGQIVFVDTPGVHKPTHRLNVRMVDTALEAMREVDLVALVVDASVKSGPGDRFLMKVLKDAARPAVLVLTKVDLVSKPKLLPLLEQYQREYPFAEFVPVSALDGTNVEALEQVLLAHLPDGEPLYPDDYLTDQPERVYVAEIVREKVLQLTHDELPFSTAVVVDRFEEAGEDSMMQVYCTILVERDSQKPIVVGKGGSMIKAIGTAAREELERFFATRLFLDLHVKVKSEWRNDNRVLDELGVRGRDR
jgi:GTP-binding protein Era